MFQLKLQYCSLGPLTLLEMVPVNSAPSMAQTSLQIGASALILLALIQIMLLCCQLLIRQKQSMCYLTAHGRKVWWKQPGCIPIAAPRVINRLTFLENSVALCSLSSTLALSTHWSVIYKQPGAWKRTKHTSICKLQGALLTRCLRFHIRHRMKTIKRTKSEQNKMNLSVSHPPLLSGDLYSVMEVWDVNLKTAPHKICFQLIKVREDVKKSNIFVLFCFCRWVWKLLMSLCWQVTKVLVTQHKRGAKKKKRVDENLHHPYFINSFGVQELRWENNWQQLLSPATFNHKTNGKSPGLQI